MPELGRSRGAAGPSGLARHGQGDGTGEGERRSIWNVGSAVPPLPSTTVASSMAIVREAGPCQIRAFAIRTLRVYLRLGVGIHGPRPCDDP